MLAMVISKPSYLYCCFWKWSKSFWSQLDAENQLNLKQIYKVVSDIMLDNLLDQHSELFEPGLGKLKSFKAKIHVDPLNFARSILFLCNKSQSRRITCRIRDRRYHWTSAIYRLSSTHCACPQGWWQVLKNMWRP